MNWPALFASVVLVAPVVAQSGQAPPLAVGSTVRLRACVDQGNHGSVGNLRQIEVVAAPGAGRDPRHVMYWFAKNLEGFRTYAGSRVEIAGTVAELIQGAMELKATDGVFAEVHAPAGDPAVDAAAVVAAVDPSPGVAAVGTAGSGAVAAVASDSAAPAMTIVKTDVTSLRTLGPCQ
jgi:hypothetical protein